VQSFPFCGSSTEASVKKSQFQVTEDVIDFRLYMRPAKRALCFRTQTTWSPCTIGMADLSLCDQKENSATPQRAS
jgi:hypothetical protein